MKNANKQKQSKQTYINLNYKGRKAVINLSLKQLSDIVGTDIDIEDYKHILDKTYFLEYPKQLKAKVLLEHQYLQLMETTEQYQDSISKLEDNKKNIESLKMKLVTAENHEKQLQEQMQNKDKIIADLTKQIHEKNILLTELKTSNKHISNDNDLLRNEIKEVNNKFNALKETSLIESINNERDFEKLAYELQSYSWFDMVFTNKKKKWVNKFLDKLHLQEIQRDTAKLEGETKQDNEK